jgi:benzoyl-CoA reductase/2-hydroxyglutaryl-CoA dehydratase subunit BcrC/BadD/HgdB
MNEMSVHASSAGEKSGRKLTRQERLVNKVRLHLAMTVREIFEQIEQDETRPRAMAYFDEIFRKFMQAGEGVIKAAPDQKVVGTYCVFVPEEIVYAAGAYPVRLCAGAYDTQELGEDFLPDVACPMVKSEMGLASMPILEFYQRCDVVALPASCHWKLKMGEMLAPFDDVHMLDVPRVKESEKAREYWLEEVKRFKERVEKLTGRRIRRKHLREAIRRIQRAQREVVRFQNLRKHIPAVILGRDALEVLNAYFYDEVDSWTAALAALNDELEERVEKGIHVAPPRAARILLTGSPMVFPNWKVPFIIEDLGGILVADEFCTSQRYLADMVSVDEGTMGDMLMAIAERYVLPCACPTFSNTIERRDRIARLIDEYQVEGVIYHVLKGCHPYDIELKIIEKLLQEKGVPMLKIETDYSPEDVEQLRTRIEAFQETLKGRN